MKHEPDRSVCPDCGGGWTFDFAERSVYCRRCRDEAQAVARSADGTTKQSKESR